MSDETTIAVPTAPKQRGVPFKPGQSGNPAGRPRGSRNRLADAFVTDLAAAWEEHGVMALTKCATAEPAKFVSIIASLLPRDVSLNVTHSVDPLAFHDRFRQALELLGNAEPAPKVIEHGPRPRNT
jgi:hypothetical protein